MEAILRHAQMANVDHAARVEVWLSEILYYSVPRSDPVIPLVVDHFGWDKLAVNWDQPFLVEELVRRRLAFNLIDQVAAPGHELHKAWLDLTSDRERIGFRSMAHANNVAGLLEAIRTRCPAAEGALNPYRVALWDDRFGRSIQDRLKYAMFVFWGVFILFKMMAWSGAPATPEAPASQPVLRSYTQPDVYLEPIVRGATGQELGVAGLRSSNPSVYSELESRWEQARAANDQSTGLDVDLRNIIDGHMREALRGGGYQLQSAYWSWSADRMAWLRKQGVEDCAETERPAAHTLPEALRRRQSQLFASALREPPPKNPAPALAPGAETRFRIPGPIFDAAGRESGLVEADLKKALIGEGSPAQRCAAKIGLIHAAIAAPRKSGQALIRDLSAVL